MAGSVLFHNLIELFSSSSRYLKNNNHLITEFTMKRTLKRFQKSSMTSSECYMCVQFTFCIQGGGCCIFSSHLSYVNISHYVNVPVITHCIYVSNVKLVLSWLHELDISILMRWTRDDIELVRLWSWSSIV